MNVSELVDVLNDALDATQDALEAADEANQESVLCVGFLGHLQQEVQKLNYGQHKRSKSLQ